MVQTDDPVPPSRLQRKLPRALETICLKCLAKDPRKRYTSAGELAGRLRLFLDGKPIPDRPMGWIERGWRTVRRHPAVSVFLALLVVGIALLLAVNHLSDPARVLAGLQCRLDRGEAVTLIGETGAPAWYRWQLGESRTKASTRRDAPFSVTTNATALVELLPDPRRTSYRFSALVQHDDGEEGWVGLYFGHSAHETAGGAEHYFCYVSFSDLGESRGNARLDFKACGEGGPNYYFLNQNQGTRLRAAFTNLPPPGSPTPWRELVVERTPRETRLFCDGVQLSSMERPVPRLTSLSEADMERQARSFFRKRPNPTGINPRFAPREGLGLYVFQATANFRRVTVTPLPEESEP
jgi:hypothetical protein